jgi:Zn-dependent M28 family amino/carboxypeptidase
MLINQSIHSIHFYLGSGTVATLVLALNLARLFQTSSSSYSTYQYRVRFCWWGAEELGLLGSIYHIAQASLPNNTVVGERVQDYLLNLNCDMIASPNYFFGIHDVSTAPATTPSQALNGTSRIADLFRQWFNEQKLPWSDSTLCCTDFIPFLAAGIPVGDVHTGTSDLKPADERDRYSAMLGIGNGGIANAGYDPCYHRQCDRITNINPFAFEKVVQSVAYAIEYLGRLNDLQKWLYPQDRSTNFAVLNKNQLYNFQNDPDII